MTRYLVTSALPYANGPIHFGHVTGAYLPADVYVRTLRMQGEDVVFICGTDEYGVAITIAADKAQQDYPEYVLRWHDEILATFRAFSIDFDIFSGTSRCEPHAETALDFFRDLDANGYLEKQTTEQLYCPEDRMFLADRYVRGTCYECGYEESRGDECPSCGTWTDPLRLIDPSCKICGTRPEKRPTTHWYLDMPKLRDEYIGQWITDHEWKANVRAFVTNMMKDVPKRAITRDLKWGISLPADLADGEEGKVLFVWFDAPIGYISFTKELMAQRGEPEAWRDYWQGPDTRIVHFIGKDNIPFHCMLFPAMLYGVKQGYTLPYAVPANEFYNLEGGKFSTSEGRTFDVEAFLDTYDEEVVRFHLIASMPETSDSEFTMAQFVQTNNSVLAATVGNLVTRVLKFVAKNFEGRVPPIAPEHRGEMDELILNGCGDFADPAEEILRFRFRRAAEQLVANAAVANVFMDRMAPWALRKTDLEKAQSSLNTLCEWIAWVARWMVPFMPGKAQAIWEMLGYSDAVCERPWPGVPTRETLRSLPAAQELGEPAALFPRID